MEKSQTDHWSNKSEAGVEYGIRFMVWAYKLAGRWFFNLCLLPVITYFFLFRQEERRASIDYWKTLKAYTKDIRGFNCILSFKQFWLFGQALIDKLAVWMGEYSMQDIDVHNAKVFDDLLARKQGGVLLISHLGNFEITRCLSALHQDVQLTVLMHSKHAENFNRVLAKYTGARQVEVLEVTEITPITAMQLSEKVEAGGYIAIAADRVPVGSVENSLSIKLLGREARLPVGPYAIASILKAPIISLNCIKLNGRYQVYFDVVSKCFCPPRQERGVAYLEAAKTYVKILEQYCLMAPAQWFNFYAFWK